MLTIDLRHTITVQCYLDPDVSTQLAVFYASVVDRRGCRQVGPMPHANATTFDAVEYVVKLNTPEVTYDAGGVLVVDDFREPQVPRVSVQRDMAETMVSMPGWIDLGITVLRGLDTTPGAGDPLDAHLLGVAVMRGLTISSLMGKEYDALAELSARFPHLRANHRVDLRDLYLRASTAWRSALGKEGRIIVSARERSSRIFQDAARSVASPPSGPGMDLGF